MSSICSDFMRVSDPADGRVVLLNNFNNGSQIYLIGTTHYCKGCANTVKKVINHVMPDSVAIELCMRRARIMLESVSEDDDIHTLYLKSKIVPGGLAKKVGILIRNCWDLLLGDVRSSSRTEMEVAMEESSRVGAECFFIDQDINVLDEEKTNLLSDESIRRSVDKAVDECSKLYERIIHTRSSCREYASIFKEVCPEYYKLIIEDRDKLMFTRLREMKGKLIVVVVGMGHMDGIELLWKRAEDVGDVKPFGATSEDADQQKQ